MFITSPSNNIKTKRVAVYELVRTYHLKNQLHIRPYIITSYTNNGFLTFVISYIYIV